MVFCEPRYCITDVREMTFSDLILESCVSRSSWTPLVNDSLSSSVRALAKGSTAMAGGLLGIAAAVRRGVILPALLQARGLLVYTATMGRRGSRTTIDDPNAQTIPYGVAIAAGTVVACLFPLSIGVAS